MSLFDLSCPFPPAAASSVRLREVPLKSDRTAYTGMVYDFSFHSMDGSYLDLPGHIRETDDARRADTVDPADFYRVPCSVIRLDRKSGSGAVTASELETAFGGPVSTPGLLINALGTLEPDQIDNRSVWLDLGAVDWIIHSGVRLLVSDIYESKSLDGVFLKLFRAGISTVCEPRGMWRLRSKTAELTVSFPRFPGLTQFPCRILADDGIPK